MTANIYTKLARDLTATAFNPDASDSPAELATYTPKGGTPVTDVPLVRLMQLGERQNFMDDSTATSWGGEVMIQLSADGVGDVSVGDAVTIDGAEHTVEEVIEKIPLIEAKLRVTRRVTSRAGRQLQ